MSAIFLIFIICVRVITRRPPPPHSKKPGYATAKVKDWFWGLSCHNLSKSFQHFAIYCSSSFISWEKSCTLPNLRQQCLKNNNLRLIHGIHAKTGSCYVFWNAEGNAKKGTAETPKSEVFLNMCISDICVPLHVHTLCQINPLYILGFEKLRFRWRQDHSRSSLMA